MTNLLETRGLSKSFGGLKAVDGVDLNVDEGTIHTVIGPNGSGKSTLLNVINRIYTPTEGTVTFCGHNLDGLTPTDVTVRGIGRTFQNVRLFPDLSVLDNVTVGQHCRTHCKTARGFRCVLCAWIRPASLIREEAHVQEKAKSILKLVGLSDKATVLAKNLPYGQRKMLELARALATEPRLLLLDEPAAGLSPTEMTFLMDLIRSVRDQGVTVLLVEHRMKLVMSISDQLTVLNFGKRIAVGSPKEVQANDEVIRAYLGSGHQDAVD